MARKPYQAEIYGRLKTLDYRAERPFAGWKDAHLETSIRVWLVHNPPCLELATLAQDELTLRHRDLNSGLHFAGARLEPVPWLGAAREAVLALAETKRQEEQKTPPRGRKGNVYVVLRDGYSAENQWYGAYVGSTVKPIEKRFVEHRTGVRSGRGLPAHGIEPLYSLCDPINPVIGGKARRLEWETRLHEALAPVIPKVTGDVAY